MIHGRKMVFAAAAFACTAIQTAGQSPSLRPRPSETYRSADVDADGNLRIVTSDRRTIIVRKDQPPSTDDSDHRQTGFDTPVVSPDRRAVGAQAMFTNCCTSYDIPLQLVVYSQGNAHRFQGDLAIFDWHFADGGRRVVFSQQPVHFACAVLWQLFDVATERLLAQANIPEPCGLDPVTQPVKVPSWVTGSVSGFEVASP